MTPRPNTQAYQVLTALQSGPRTTAELAPFCPLSLSSVVANLRHQGYRINMTPTNDRQAIYTLHPTPVEQRTATEHTITEMSNTIAILDRAIDLLANKLSHHTGLDPQAEITTAIAIAASSPRARNRKHEQ